MARTTANADDDDSKSPLKQYIKVGLAIVVCVFLLASLIKLLSREAPRRYNENFVKSIQRLVKYATQESALSQQDDNPVFALVHATTAVSHAKMAAKLIPFKDSKRVARVDLAELILMLEDQRDKIIQRISELYPNLQPSGVHSIYTNWIA